MNNNLAIAITIAIGFIISALLISDIFIRYRAEKEITVKGYAEKAIVSDVGRISFKIEVNNIALADAYKELQRQRAIVIKGFTKLPGLKVHDFTPSIYEIMVKDEKGNETNDIERYLLKQRIEFTSSNVKLIAACPERLVKFLEHGIKIYVSSPDFYVSELDQYKKDLIKLATHNAHQRAQLLANNSGSSVGKLISARQGVFQITSRNSTETSSYGMYDTGTIEKSIKAVVTLEYAVD